MAGTLYQLGQFQFSLPNGAPETVTRNSAYRWVQQDRIGRLPAQQWMGPDSDHWLFEGIIAPGFSGHQMTMEQLREMARAGKPYMLTNGAGVVFGLQCILDLCEGKQIFMDNGNARRIVFTLDLVEYGPDKNALPGSPLAGMLGGLGGMAQAIQGVPAFIGTGSAFDALSQGLSPLAGSAAGLGAGLGAGQLAALAQTMTAAEFAPGAAMAGGLGAFGIAAPPALSATQQGVWGALGLSAPAMLGALDQGLGAPVVGLGLEALRAAAPGQISDLAGAAAPVVTSWTQNAASLGEIMNVDPQTREQVRALLTLD